MLYYDRVDLSKGIDIVKVITVKIVSSATIHGFKFPSSVCNGCNDLTILCLNISNIVINTFKDVDYCCIIHDISISEAIHLLENSVLDDCGNIQNAHRY